MKGLYAITDCAGLSTDELLSITRDILSAGAAALQYRDKSDDHLKRTHEAAELKRLCREHDCLFIVNDDVQLARAVGSDGVHLGKSDRDCKSARAELGPEAIIGISCYDSLARARAAAADGADYVAFGSFFASASKQDTVSVEPDIIKQAKAGISLPVVAIGGITPANCGALLSAGADMLAAIGSLYRAEDPHETALQFNRLFREIR